MVTRRKSGTIAGTNILGHLNLQTTKFLLRLGVTKKDLENTEMFKCIFLSIY